MVRSMVNFTEIVNTLRDSHGMSDRQIAEEAGCDTTQIYYIRKGKRGDNLSYNIGVKLVALHKQREAEALRLASQGDA